MWETTLCSFLNWKRDSGGWSWFQIGLHFYPWFYPEDTQQTGLAIWIYGCQHSRSHGMEGVPRGSEGDGARILGKPSGDDWERYNITYVVIGYQIFHLNPIMSSQAGKSKLRNVLQNNWSVSPLLECQCQKNVERLGNRSRLKRHGK